MEQANTGPRKTASGCIFLLHFLLELDHDLTASKVLET